MGGARLGDDRHLSQMLFYSVDFGVDDEREAQVLNRIARELVDIRAAGIPHGAPPMTLKSLTLMI